MGQIPARAPAPGSRVITLRHEVVGVDMNRALGLAQTQSMACPRCSSIIDVEPVEDAEIIDTAPVSDPISGRLPAIEQAAEPVPVPAVEPAQQGRSGLESPGMWDTQWLS
jgi:hypothetical protein